MTERRVVVTGLGWVTSLGLDVNKVFEKLLAGESGVTLISRFPTDEYPTKIGSEVKDWDAPHIEKRDAKRLDRFTQFAVNAAADAIIDAGIDFAKEDPFRCGAVIGSGIGGIEEFEDGHRKFVTKGWQRVSPFMVPKLMCNAAPGNVAIHFGIKGPNLATTSACASGGHGIGDAFNLIRQGDAEIMVSGGTEAALTPLGLTCFMALRAISTRNDDPAGASRPFDADRDGFILGEGAGILILEELEHAKARGAKIYCEIKGYGQSCDGSHITAPDEQGRGASAAMSRALNDAKMNPQDIGYINAHGTSTPLGDVAEVTAIKNTFGEHAYKLAVSSTKSMIGHTLGASGGIEAIATIKCLESQTLHPTINHQTPGEGCDLDFVPNQAREASFKAALTNSFGFGGHNVSLCVAKFEG